MNFVGLDIETTGLDYRKGHRLIQIGIAFHRMKVYNYDMWPLGLRVNDPEAMAVNKFTEERICKGIPQHDLDDLLSTTFRVKGFKDGSLTAVGWNVGPFDLPFVREELPKTAKYFSHRVVDLTSIAIFLSGGKDNWRELKEAEHKKVEKDLEGFTPDWHDAGWDALAALVQWSRWAQWHS